MDDVKKRRRSRWGDAEKKEEDKEVDINNNNSNNLENINNNINILLNKNNEIPIKKNNSIMNIPVSTSLAYNNLNNSIFSSNIHLNILKATEAARLAIEKVKRSSRFKENDNINKNRRRLEFIPKPLMFDEEGREVDDEGNVINIKPITFSTLKVNMNKLDEDNMLKKKNDDIIINKNLNIENINNDINKENSLWFDNRIKNVSKRKEKKSGFFNFITPGSFIKHASNKQYNNKALMNFDLKKIMEEKKKVQSFQELSLNFLNNNINESINPNMININKKDDKISKFQTWDPQQRYDMLEYWDTDLFILIEHMYLKNENNVDYINEFIKTEKQTWQDKYQYIINNKTNDIHNNINDKHNNNINDKHNNNINDKHNSNNNNSNNNLCASLLSHDEHIQLNNVLIKCDVLLLLNDNKKIKSHKNNIYMLIVNNLLYIINFNYINHYIEHPVSLNEDKKENDDDDDNINMTHMFLTPQERKKLRKRKRQEKEREKQDKIRIGLMPPPPPKMKLSNLMRVMGESALAQPSKAEYAVREQMKERELRHFEENQKRKLKPEERTKKKINKWKSNSDEENDVLLIYITNLSNKKHIFKIDINAQQLHLTGVCFMTVLYNFIIVEGKHVSIERYKRLIFRRIKWNEEEYDDEQNDNEDNHIINSNEKNQPQVYPINNNINQQDNNNNNNNNYNNNDSNDNSLYSQHSQCSLIWNGVVKKKNFKNWKMIVAKTEMEVTDYLSQHDALHYYHIIKKHRSVLDHI
ncbi:putative U4/U6 small nuclear ribonucleoprotein PRP3 [Plasmodium gaboni]|uniref:Putative U4/U6 small nuclear ribonucleoprotein PRP3 n=1 Tax=Plasmodium gaboni TaxID=647221 RepID=A0A151LD39_9APIC|nr:putative U4/U6 small nuclear ribonucleoprotein PRP3 [Plasmodium gaboni]KYN96895.1 putative U4/U6 small nuclear ribonucleoprotein PRP3 [Plasmodium gaboni]